MQLHELMEQKQQLDAQINHVKNEVKSEVISEIKAKLESHGLSIDDLSDAFKHRSSVAKGRKVAVKYRDGAGNEWTGRGRMPKWAEQAKLRDGDLNQYLVG